MAGVPSGRADTLVRGIGRSLHRVPGAHAVSFVDKTDPDRWVIRRLDLDTRTAADVAPALPGREDYAWTPDGGLLASDGTRLFAWSPDRPAWHVAADLSASGVVNVSRLAVSPRGDLVAFVAEPAGD